MEGYSMSRVYFASMYVQESVYDRFAEQNHDRLMHFIWHSAGNPLLSAMRGTLFEEHVHRRLASDESFEVRRLDEPAEGSGDEVERVTFGKLSTLMVHGVSDIRAGHYCRPQTRNFESIDAVVAPSSLFQITVGEKHPVKSNGLAQLQPQLASSGPIRLYFVVPPDRWGSFKRQSYVTKKGELAWVWWHGAAAQSGWARCAGEEAKVVRAWIRERVQQYALKLGPTPTPSDEDQQSA
jgi:hypothetical protein